MITINTLTKIGNKNYPDDISTVEAVNDTMRITFCLIAVGSYHNY